MSCSTLNYINLLHFPLNLIHELAHYSSVICCAGNEHKILWFCKIYYEILVPVEDKYPTKIADTWWVGRADLRPCSPVVCRVVTSVSPFSNLEWFYKLVRLQRNLCYSARNLSWKGAAVTFHPSPTTLCTIVAGARLKTAIPTHFKCSCCNVGQTNRTPPKVALGRVPCHGNYFCHYLEHARSAIAVERFISTVTIVTTHLYSGATQWTTLRTSKCIANLVMVDGVMFEVE